MQTNAPLARVAKKWSEILGGLVAAALLIPLPAFAVGFTFTNITWNTPTWTSSGGSTDPFTSFTAGTPGSTTDTISFGLNGTPNTNISGTYTVTSSSVPVTTNYGGTATWAGLSNIYDISAGTVGVTIPVTNATTSNMFSASYSSSSQPTSGPSGTATFNGTSTVLTVTFTFSNATFNTNSTNFTLTFS